MSFSAGIVRRVKRDGRIELPRELMNLLDIKPGDELVYFLSEEGHLVLQKVVRPGCVFCGLLKTLRMVGSKPVCVFCITEMKYEIPD